MRGGVSATPGASALFAISARIAQQIEVTASHEFDAGAHQPNGAVAQVVRLPPSPSRNAHSVKENLRDSPIGLVSQATVESPKCKGETLAALCRQPVRWRQFRPAGARSPQLERPIGSPCEICIDRDNHRHWICGFRAVDEQQRQAIATVTADQIIPFAGAALKCRSYVQSAGVLEAPRCGGDKNDTGVEMWQPDERGSIGGKTWIDREIAIPNAEQALRPGHLLALRR